MCERESVCVCERERARERAKQLKSLSTEELDKLLENRAQEVPPPEDPTVSLYLGPPEVWISGGTHHHRITPLVGPLPREEGTA